MLSDVALENAVRKFIPEDGDGGVESASPRPELQHRHLHCRENLRFHVYH